MKYYQNFNLTNYNSFKIQSIAKEIWFPETFKGLSCIIKKLKGQEFEILAGGTNILMNETINRIICLKSMEQIITTFSELNNHFFATASSPLSGLINGVINQRLSGLEGLIGIPGTIGGAIVMNSGSGKYSISDYLKGIVTIDLNGNKKYYHKKDLKFRRRYSILQDKKEILISAMFAFKNQKPDQKMINKVKKYRTDFPKGYSAGGIFVNHYDLTPYEKEIRNIKSNHLTISKYLNVIINDGKSTSKEILEFISKIKQIVKKSLKLEIKLMGFKK